MNGQNRTTLVIGKNRDGQIGDGSPVDRAGLATPKGTYLVSRNQDLILIFLPGHHYWRSQGSDFAYAGAEYEVWRVTPDASGYVARQGDSRVWAERVLSFPGRRAR